MIDEAQLTLFLYILMRMTGFVVFNPLWGGRSGVPDTRLRTRQRRFCSNSCFLRNFIYFSFQLRKAMLSFCLPCGGRILLEF